jgi:alkaline phosphatase
VEIAAWGPGSDRIPAFVRNTYLFDLMVDMAGVRAYADRS